MRLWRSTALCSRATIHSVRGLRAHIKRFQLFDLVSHSLRCGGHKRCVGTEMRRRREDALRRPMVPPPHRVVDRKRSATIDVESQHQGQCPAGNMRRATRSVSSSRRGMRPSNSGSAASGQVGYVTKQLFNLLYLSPLDPSPFSAASFTTRPNYLPLSFFYGFTKRGCDNQPVRFTLSCSGHRLHSAGVDLDRHNFCCRLERVRRLAINLLSDGGAANGAIFLHEVYTMRALKSCVAPGA